MRHGLLAVLAVSSLAACGGAGELAGVDELVPAAGFVELAGVDYELSGGGQRLALQSTDTRLFWAFQPADDEADDAPLLVFFNGGPGVSSGLLLGLNTGPMSFDPKLTGDDATVVANPDSWTSLGNLLWIDARQTGFSYGLLDDPASEEARAAAMSFADFNAYRDAADVVRALLVFLAEHPQLQDNEIVIVGESYGGTRAQLMLDMLLHPSLYEDGSRRMRDTALASAIRDHHQRVHGEADDPAVVAAQFGRQVLIQPLLTGQLQKHAAGLLYEQPDSIVEQLATELGVEFLRCAEQVGDCDPFRNAMDFLAAQDRSGHDYRAPSSWAHDIYELVRFRLNDVDSFEALLGVEAQTIAGLSASERVGAYRMIGIDTFASDAAYGDWPEHGGALLPWDRYFVVFNTAAKTNYDSEQAQALELDPYDPHYGELFLSNLLWVETLVTDAAFDLATTSRGVPPSLTSYDTIVAAVTADDEAELWTIEYDAQGLGMGQTRHVTVPHYPASHAVTYDASGSLRADVEDWMGSSPSP